MNQARFLCPKLAPAIAGAFFMALVGCTSIGTHIPAVQMESPETNGKWLKAKLMFAGASITDVKVVDDASYRPLTFNTPTKQERDSEFYVTGSMGIIERLDIGWKAGLIRSPQVLFVKYQFLGSNFREAKEGNQSLAIVFGVGTYNLSRNGDQNGLFGRGGYRWTAEQKTHSREAQLVYGYRTTDTVLVYGGPYYSDYKMGGRIYHERSDDGLSPAADYRIDQEGTRAGVNGNVELRFSKEGNGFFTFAAGYSKLMWTNSAERYDLDYGLALTFGL